MLLASRSSGLVFALCFTASAFAQAEGDVTTPGKNPTPNQIRTQAAEDLRLHLDYATFDPLLGTPMVPQALLAGAQCHLYIVQFDYAFTDADREAIRDAGGTLHLPVPHNAVIVRMDAGQAANVRNLPGVRWVGPYQPAYRLEPELLTEHASGIAMPKREYNLVMSDKHNEKLRLERKIQAIGGKVTDRQNGGLLMIAELTGEQLLQVAQFDEVLWIDRTTPKEEDMNNARAVQGSNWLETNYGYTGAGIRGHVYEGVEYNHPDFTYAMVNVRSGGQPQTHGHATAGCVFGNGTSHPSARAHARNARGYYTNYSTVTAGWSRNQVIGEVVNVYNCMFTTASWGNARTTAYTSVSADADDIVFDHRIPWTQSQSNAGNQMSRPQAWGKNVISIGGMYHYNDSNPGNDAWGGGGSTGPAADGRIKPDLCNFYDSVLCSDRSGSAGYTSTNYTTSFGGTSAATPITAGLNALAIQIWTNHVLGNAPRVSGGTRFQNRPYAQMLKALQIVCASTYPFGTGVGQTTRYRGGWGYANVRTIRENAGNFFFVNEDKPIQQGQTHTYKVEVAPNEPVLKICMTYLDPQGNVAASIDRINDLTLRVTEPNGSTSYWGNHGLTTGNNSTTGGSANTVDTVECVFRDNPTAGVWTIQITAPVVAQDAYLATGATDAVYALAVRGATEHVGCDRYNTDNDPATGLANSIPFGPNPTSTVTSVFGSNNGGSTGGVVFFDITPSTNLYLHGLDLNTSVTSGTGIEVDVYTHTGGYSGFETNMSAWTARTAGHGTSAGLDNASRVDFDRGLYMANGTTYGVAVVARNFNHRYTNGSNTYSNGDLTLDTGAAQNVPFSSPTYTPRTANVTLRYQRDNATWHNQILQTVLRKADLKQAGDITGLAFAPSDDGRHYNRYLRIRMKNVPAGYTMTTNFANNISGATQVMYETDYVWHHRADDWNEIGLEAPFAYNGTGDVLVEIWARGNTSQTGSTGAFRRGSEQRLYAYGWGFASQPATGTLSSGAPKIRAEFACAETGEFETSCGPARADGYSEPVAGTTYWFDIHDAEPNSGAFCIMGLSNTESLLTSSGFTNCRLWNTVDATIFKVTSGSGFAFHTVNLPNTTQFDGLKIYACWASLDPNAAGGLTFTNQVRMIIGQEAPTQNPNF